MLGLWQRGVICIHNSSLCCVAETTRHSKATKLNNSNRKRLNRGWLNIFGRSCLFRCHRLQFRKCFPGHQTTCRSSQLLPLGVPCESGSVSWKLLAFTSWLEIFSGAFLMRLKESFWRVSFRETKSPGFEKEWCLKSSSLENILWKDCSVKIWQF